MNVSTPCVEWPMVRITLGFSTAFVFMVFTAALLSLCFIRFLLHMLRQTQQSSFQVLCSERTGFRDQMASGIHAPPDIPQEGAAHPALTHIIYDAFAVRLPPIGYRFQM